MGPSRLVSIGLPVFNGEKYLASALDALLAQDYGHFEVLVSDNASTDATPDICARYGRADTRLTFHRHPRNIGAARNFNTVFEQSRGDYFMWAAHDDLWHPSYVSQCARVLDREPDVVLCNSTIRFIDEDDVALPPEDFTHFNRLHTHGMSLRRRVDCLSRALGWFSLYGLLRREALCRTNLYPATFGGDVILLMELLFLGQTYELSEPLFSYRLIRKSAARYITDITGSHAEASPAQVYTGLAVALLQLTASAPCGPAGRAALRNDLLANVSHRNHHWRHLIVQEHPHLAGLPARRQDVEIRALLAPDTSPIDMATRRAFAHLSGRLRSIFHPRS